jgi:hypothetical protein
MAKIAEREGASLDPITPKDAVGWKRVLRSLTATDLDDLAEESIILYHPDGDGVMTVTRRAVDTPVRETEISPSTGARIVRDADYEPVTVADELFEVTVVNRNGEQVRHSFESGELIEGQARSHVALDELADYVTSSPFADSEVRYTGHTQLIHDADPELVAKIIPTRAGQEGVQIGYYMVDEKGTLKSLTKNQVPYKRTMPSEAAATEYLAGLNYRAKSWDPFRYWNTIREVRAGVPDPEAASAMTLMRAHRRLKEATTQYLQENVVLSSDLRKYLQDFGRAWVRKGIQQPPFSGSIREALGAVTIQDLRQASFGEMGRAMGGGSVRNVRGRFQREISVARPRAVDLEGETTRLARAEGLGGAWPEEVWLGKDKVAPVEQLEEWKELLMRDIQDEKLLDVRASDSPEPSAHTAMGTDYAVLDDGRTVKVTDPRHGAPDMAVETFDGTAFEVANDAAEISRGPKRDLFWAKLMRVAQGDEAGIPGTLPAGAGVVERELGLLGIQDKGVLGEGLKAALLEEVAKVTPVGGQGPFKGKARVKGARRFKGTPEQYDKVASIYRRAKELEVDIAGLGIPEELERPLKWSVYKSVQAEYGDHPVFDLAARGILGELDPDELTKLNNWAGEFGLSGQPAHVQLEGLIERGQIDPLSAKLAFQLKNDIGSLGWWEGAGDNIKGRVVIRGGGGARTPKDITYLGFADFHLPHKLKHPTAKGYVSTIYRAAENEQRYRDSATRLLLELQADGYKHRTGKLAKKVLGPGDKNITELRQIVEKYPGGWDQAAKAGVDPKYQRGFTALKDWFDEKYYDTVWLKMKRGQQARPLRRMPDGSVHWEDQYLMSKTGLLDKFPEGQIPDDFLIIDDVRGQQGVMTDEEIDRFVHYLRDPDIPDSAVLQQQDGATPAMIEQFDFWKNWKIDNYWPYIHEGNMVIFEVMPDGSEVTKGFTFSTMDALDLIRYGIKQNKLSKAGQFGIREIAPMLDDVGMQILPNKQYWDITSRVGRAVGMDPDEVSAILSGQAGALAPGPSGKRAPFFAHAEKRLADLRPIKEDPFLEIILYNSRIARAKYKHEILSGVAKWTELDESISRANNMAPLRMDFLSNEQGGAYSGMATMMRDEIRQALGAYTRQDYIADYLIGLRNMMGQATKETALWATGKSPMTIREIWQRAHYFKPYSARKYAGDIIGLQAMLKLGANPMSAFVNLTQTLTNTAPLVGTRRTVAGIREAGKFLHAGMPGGMDINGAEYQFLKELVDEAGIEFMPAKQLAGVGWADQIGKKAPKMGRTLLGQGFDTAQYYSMYLFNGAERINRISSLFAGYRHAIDDLGMAEGAAREFAKDIVVKTQFLYTTQAMPMFMKGPVARVLFQFKPFLVNQVSFEKDLLMQIVRNPGNRQAWGAMGRHMGMYTAFGGLRGVVNHPLFMTWNGLAALGGWKATEDWLLSRNRYGKEQETAGLFRGSDNFTARDLLVHGIPGLLGGSIGDRIGVSGQELNADNFIMGPHTTIMKDTFDALMAYTKAGGGAGKGLAGWGVGSAVALAAGLNKPYQPLLVGAAAGLLSSSLTDNPMIDFMDTRQGRKAWNSMMPTAYRNFDKTWDLMQGVTPRNINFAPLQQPWQLNRTEQAIWNFMGAQTVDDTEARAYARLILDEGEKHSAKRAMYGEQLAHAVVEADLQKYHTIAARAAKQGIAFEYSDIQARVERMRIPAMESVRQAQPVQARLPFLIGGGGRRF